MCEADTVIYVEGHHPIFKVCDLFVKHLLYKVYYYAFLNLPKLLELFSRFMICYGALSRQIEFKYASESC